jgi:hypothetical protein
MGRYIFFISIFWAGDYLTLKYFGFEYIFMLILKWRKIIMGSDQTGFISYTYTGSTRFQYSFPWHYLTICSIISTAVQRYFQTVSFFKRITYIILFNSAALRILSIAHQFQGLIVSWIKNHRLLIIYPFFSCFLRN